MRCWFSHNDVTDCEHCFARNECQIARTLKVPRLGELSMESVLPKDQGLQPREDDRE
jgi:hypothetical protein